MTLRQLQEKVERLSPAGIRFVVINVNIFLVDGN